MFLPARWVPRFVLSKEQFVPRYGSSARRRFEHVGTPLFLGVLGYQRDAVSIVPR